MGKGRIPYPFDHSEHIEKRSQRKEDDITLLKEFDEIYFDMINTLKSFLKQYDSYAKLSEVLNIYPKSIRDLFGDVMDLPS